MIENRKRKVFEILGHLIFVLIISVSSEDTKVAFDGSSIQPGPEVIKLFYAQLNCSLKLKLPK